ncbi:MAG: hypothetical protein HKN82_14835 [Akkermansiaceae bacterium]|nr:hypothetical protein [Akkermansiaceae bacterium]
MKNTHFVTHASWIAIAVAAFFVGDRLSPDGAGAASATADAAGSASKSARPDAKSERWDFRPPTVASAYAIEMESVMAETDEELRINRANRLINGLTPEVLEGLTPGMVPGLLQLFDDVKGSAGVSRKTIDAHGDLIAAWARFDPEAAARHAADRSKQYYPWKVFPSSMSYHMGDVREAYRGAAIAEWAKVDLAGAKKFVDGVEYKYAREDMKMGLLKHLTATDLDEAMTWSAELEAGRTGSGERFEMSYLVTQIKNQRGMKGMKAWLDTVPYAAAGDGSLSYKESAVFALGEEMLKAREAAKNAAREAVKEAEKEAAADGSPDSTESALAELRGMLEEMTAERGWPAEYVEFLKENANEPFVTAEVLSASRRSPTYSIEMIINLPEEIGARREAVGNEFQRLANNDFKYAGKWLREQERGPVHDEAIQVYVREATQDDLTTAMQWAREITDPVLRAETIEYVQERGGR